MGQHRREAREVRVKITAAPMKASGWFKKEYPYMFKVFKCSVVCGNRKWDMVAVAVPERLVITRS